MTAAKPYVSIIISAYHSDGVIAGCIESLSRQTFRDFEIIVVNSSQEERTRQVITAKFHDVIFVQSSKRLSPHEARNRGIRLARGELFALTDPDCRADKNWLTHLVEVIEAGIDVATGSMKSYYRNWYEQGVHLCKFHWNLSGLPAGPCWIIPTSNACYRREVFEDVGFFEPDLEGADALQSWRAQARGYRLWFEPKAVVKHIHRENILTLWNKRFNRGKEFAQMRTTFEGWPRMRTALYFVSMPLLLLTVMKRAYCDSLRSGLARIYFLTLPVQLAGQLAWSMGEALMHWKLIVVNSSKKGVS